MGWSCGHSNMHNQPPPLHSYPRIITLAGIAWAFLAGRHLNSTDGAAAGIVAQMRLKDMDRDKKKE